VLGIGKKMYGVLFALNKDNSLLLVWTKMTYLEVKDISGGDNDNNLLVFPDFDSHESLLEDIEDTRVMVCDITRRKKNYWLTQHITVGVH